MSKVLFSSSYCFSASSPPYLCAAARIALSLITAERLKVLHDNISLAQNEMELLSQSSSSPPLGMILNCTPDSPVIIIKCEKLVIETVSSSSKEFLSVGRDLHSEGISVYLQQSSEMEKVRSFEKEKEPSLRLCITATHTPEQIKSVVRKLSQSWANCLEKNK